ncbi:MAG: N-acetylmuramoyl-L-alanine amidase [Gaiellaceae bacterium]
MDPGHGTPPAIGAEIERIGPGSPTRKIKDGGGAPGEAPVALAIARRTQALLRAQGFRVASTRTGPSYLGGNIDRARFCNERHAALMIRIHADGSSDPARHGISTLYPAFHRGWTDDIYARSLRAARLVQRALVQATGALDLGIAPRSDLTGFKWAGVPAVLVETGFTSNRAERARLESGAYEQRIASGLVAAVRAFTRR